MIIRLFLFVGFMCCANIYLRADFVLKVVSCDDIKLEWEGVNFFDTAPDLFLLGDLVQCPQDQTMNRVIAGARVNRFRYQLQKKSGNSFVNVGNHINSDATTQAFNNLAPGVYRVRILINGTDNEDVFTYVHPCSNPIGRRVDNENNNLLNSNQVELGPLESDFTLGDIDFNNIYCKNEIDASGGIFMDTRNSYGETSYVMFICQEDPNNSSQCVNWTSTGWQTGKVPDFVNILTDVWQFHHSGWDFWPNNTYRVTLALAQTGCNSWESMEQSFTVLPPCRLAEDEEDNVVLYPNPATSEIQLSGIEMDGESLPYIITNISGQTVKTGELLAPYDPIDVSDFSNGLYIFSAQTESRTIAKRFTVAN